MQIFKYRIHDPGANTVMMPAGAEVLSVTAASDGIGFRVWVWAKVDPDAPLESRRFYAAMTGEDLGVIGRNDRFRFVGTVFLVHVFVEILG